ncbi:UNVERIFIED_ORG: hypothetical protein J2806_004444 [Kosakonia oryzae]|uniref:Phage replication protein P n=1 Tax=Kosakonia radicincitans TaxID=283686 RepID=A0AAX2EWA3_9ENTR|nr:hypothetical protein [Kosakonia radicincitans]MDP9568757.1 hypothetical protein [Kosakonia oryzae]SFF16132.1 phage replication protein P [Kosakonia radicincitans]SFR22331.1 phage replication protein P [Kosakonia radicincitans]SFT99213.1 phage replication protein P [Kosakonia radicincitans]SFY15044.1 phage replication protein P [Kosakonia radicincitans]
MKNIAESMHDFDRENFRRVAAGLPENQEEQSQGEKLKALAGLFNGLFRELCAIFRECMGISTQKTLIGIVIPRDWHE